MPFTFDEALLDLPEVESLIAAIVGAVAAEKSAKSFSERQKISEPIQEKLAALIDKVSAQVAS